MGDFVLITGDIVMFNPTFGIAMVVPIPGTLIGSGKGSVGGKPVCVDGDEKNVLVPGCVYTAGPYTIPGVGMLLIDSLGPDQKALKTKSAGKPVLLKGSTFIAKFQVLAPAQQPPPPPYTAPPIPDSTPSYPGTGSFITTNIKFMGT